jgi:c-di-GMP-binding flagellar brake protein YcgR
LLSVDIFATLYRRGGKQVAEKRADRREYRRVDTQVSVTIQKYDTDERDFTDEKGKSKNLSAGGLLLHHDRPLEVPSYIIASFTLPEDEEKHDFLAKVVRIEELPDGTYEAGVMFMRMILGEFERIDKYISDQPEDS